MAATSDDAVIKRRLLIEGESGADDKRLALLLKDFLHWSSLSESSSSHDPAYYKVLEKISQCENAMEQALLIQIMNVEQSNRYSELLEEIDQSIENTNKDIAKEREYLKEARVIRKNRQEYHNLAKVVEEYPERQTNQKKLQKMKEELDRLEEIDRLYEEKINLRKKQFHLFMVALRDLRKSIEDDTPIDGSVPQKIDTAAEEMDTS